MVAENLQKNRRRKRREKKACLFTQGGAVY